MEENSVFLDEEQPRFELPRLRIIHLMTWMAAIAFVPYHFWQVLNARRSAASGGGACHGNRLLRLVDGQPALLSAGWAPCGAKRLPIAGGVLAWQRKFAAYAELFFVGEADRATRAC